MKSIFIIVLFLLELPRNALVLQGISGICKMCVWDGILAKQGKMEQVITTC
jgi:hypothetical protein